MDPSEFDHIFPGVIAHVPDFFIRKRGYLLLEVFLLAKPSVFPARLGPKGVGGGAVPASDVDAVRYVADGNFGGGPARKNGGEDVAAHLFVQCADSVDGSASADRQIGHIERLFAIVRIGSAQGEELFGRYPEPLFRVVSEIVIDQRGVEPVEACRDRRMGGEEVSDARRGERDFERGSCLLSVAPRPL